MLIETALQGKELWRELPDAIEQFRSQQAPRKIYLLLYYERNGVCSDDDGMKQNVPEGSFMLRLITRKFRASFVQGADFALLIGESSAETPLPAQYGIPVQVALEAPRRERIDAVALCNLILHFMVQRHYRPYTQPMQKHLVEALLLQCRALTLRLTKLSDHDSNTAALVQLHDMIHRFPARDWTIEEMCEIVGLSRPHLHRVYNEAFGCTCYQDVLQCRLSLADHLLATTALSVNEVSQQCGFENDSNFIRTYKKMRGCTPTAYRKEAREQKIRG